MPPAVTAMVCALSALIGYVVGEHQATQRTPVAAPVENEMILEDDVPVEALSCDTSEAELLECQTARESLRSSVAQLTQDRAELREDLEFYRGLVDLRQAERGVRAYKAEVFPLQGNRSLLRVVLVRTGAKAVEVSGQMVLRLRGTQGDDVTDVFVDRLAVGVVPSLNFAFSNFHEWEAELRLPESFQPERLIVELTIEGAAKPLVESWAWSEIKS